MCILKSEDEQFQELLSELLEKIKTSEETLPEWALEEARAHFSDPRSPLRRVFDSFKEQKGEPVILPDEPDNPDYISDPSVREIKAREYARKLVEKHGQEKPVSPLRKIFSDMAEKQTGYHSKK